MLNNISAHVCARVWIFIYEFVIMSYEVFSFYYFLCHYKGKYPNILAVFLETFRDKFDSMPDVVCSSKKLIKHLSIDTPQKLRLFQPLYLEYYKEKLTGVTTG